MRWPSQFVVIAFAGICLIQLVAVLAWLPFGMHWLSTRDMRIGDYGSWLQGTLTPLALVLAGVSFVAQALTQHEANTLNSRAQSFSMIENNRGHINYLCCAAVHGRLLDQEQSRPHGDRIYYLNLVVHDFLRLSCTKYTIRLFEDVKSIVKISENDGSLYLIDTRIIAIDNFFQTKDGLKLLQDSLGQ